MVRLLAGLSIPAVLLIGEWGARSAQAGAPSLAEWLAIMASRELARRAGHQVPFVEPMTVIPHAQAGNALFVLGAIASILVREHAHALEDADRVEHFMVAVRDAIALVRPVDGFRLH